MNNNFSYIFANKHDIIREIILSNFNFNLNNVFTENNRDNTSMTIITPSQRLSVDFKYFSVPGGHAGMADIMLEHLYPEYVPSKLIGDQNIYFDNFGNNVFILTAKKKFWIMYPNNINKEQYNEIISYIESIKNTDAYKASEIKEFLVNDDFFEITSLPEELAKIKNHITENTHTEKEYPISSIPLTSNQTEAERDTIIEDFIETYYHNVKTTIKH